MMIPLFPELSESRLNHTCDLTLDVIEMTPPETSYSQRPRLTYALPEGQKTYILKRDLITIGRSFKNSLAIPEVKSLSRTHCQIFRIEMDWYVEDCDSVNGTFLNHRRLSKGEKAKLSSNSKIHLGEFGLSFFLSPSGKIASEKDSTALKRVLGLIFFGLVLILPLWGFLNVGQENQEKNIAPSLDTRLKSRIQQEKQRTAFLLDAERKKYETLAMEAQQSHNQLKENLQKIQTELAVTRESALLTQKELEKTKALLESSEWNENQESLEGALAEEEAEAQMIPEEESIRDEKIEASQESVSEAVPQESVQDTSGIDLEVLDQLQSYILSTMESYSDPLVDIKDFKQAIDRLASENNASSAKRMFQIYTSLYQLVSDFERNMADLEKQKNELVARIPRERDLSPRLQKEQERLDLILKKIQIQEKQRIFLVQFRDWVLGALVNYKLKDSPELLALYLHPNMTPFQGQVILKVITDTNDSQAVPTLIRYLSVKDFLFRSDILRALTRLTGMNLGTAPSNWERWWNKKNPKSAKK